MSRIINKKTHVLSHVPSHVIGISSEHVERRIDNYLLAYFKTLPRSRIYQMLRRGEVRVNGGRIKQGYRLQAGDQIRLPPVNVLEQDKPDKPDKQDKPPAYLLERIQNISLYEDANLLVVNKPSGLAVHSGSGRRFGLIELLRYQCAQQGGDTELQLVHRLDQDTSGCLLIARNRRTLRHLHDTFQAAEVHKTYKTLLYRQMQQAELRVDVPLNDGRVVSGERLVAVDPAGKRALSLFQRLQSFADSSYVSVQLKTGRTHQIRVHARHLGHCVAGDKKYGDKPFNQAMRKRGLQRLFLHACELRFADPVSGNEIAVNAGLPDDLRQVLNSYENSEK